MEWSHLPILHALLHQTGHLLPVWAVLSEQGIQQNAMEADILQEQRHPCRAIQILFNLDVQRLVYLECKICSLFVGCLTSQQHASVSQGRICSDNFMCCHTEIEVADQTFHLTQSQYTDTGPTSPSTDRITPGDPRKIPPQVGFEPGIFRSQGGRLNHEANQAVSAKYVGTWH